VPRVARPADYALLIRRTGAYISSSLTEEGSMVSQSGCTAVFALGPGYLVEIEEIAAHK
jgi:hypothetical protein